MSQYGVKNARITKFVLQPTGTYNNQFRRSYELSLTPKMESRLEEAVATSAKLMPVDLVAADQQLIVPSATPESAIDIVNGWGQSRLRFWLTIEAEDNIGTKKITTLQGYSEYADLSHGNNFDPKMAFFINNISQSRLIQNYTPLGTMIRQQTIFSDQMLHDSNYGTYGLTSPNKTYSLTPDKIFGNMSNIEMVKAASFGDSADSMFIDTTNFVTGHATSSERVNGLSGQYAASILNTYLGCKASDQSEDFSEPAHAFYAQCAKTFNNGMSRNDVFLDFLESRRAQFLNFKNQAGTNTFTFDDLLAFDMNANMVTKVLPFTNGLHQQGQSANWGSSDGDTMFANSLAIGVAGLMAQFGFNSIGFRSTNMANITREMQTIFTDVKGINSHLDQTNEITGFRYRLETEILNTATFCNQIGYDVELRCDMAGDTWIQLSLDGQPEILYVVPTFCDSLFAPVVTNNRHRLNTLTEQLDTLATNLHYAKTKNSFASPREEDGFTKYHI